jgi:AraC-like DNA-binding protein/quercetin dioxygenase-like cupin family protein
MEFDEYAQYRETKLHEQPDFAYNTYLCTIPQDFDRVNPHWHDQMEVIYIKRGEGVVSVDFHRLEVRAGSIVPVLPGEIHSIDGTPGGRMEYENIIFSPGMLGGGDEDEWFRKNVLEPLRNGNLAFERPIPPGTDFYLEAKTALDGADAACTVRTPGYSLLVKGHLFEFLHALYVNRLDRPLVEPRKSADRLKAVLADVKARYAERLTVAEAASLAGYSEAHFMRVFKEETGQTFVGYLNDYRLTAATYFLRETGESIGNIAVSCGFDNESYFIRRFRARYGKTPSEYRKAARA